MFGKTFAHLAGIMQFLLELYYIWYGSVDRNFLFADVVFKQLTNYQLPTPCIEEILRQ